MAKLSKQQRIKLKNCKLTKWHGAKLQIIKGQVEETKNGKLSKH
jgi:hypothetical protein